MLLIDIAFCVFILVVLFQLYYYSFIFSKFSFSKAKLETPKRIGLSVLVCAKNEASNLKENLPDIISQDYPEFELILINDDSQDDTLLVMNEFAKAYDHVKVVDVASNDAFLGNKKYALTLGIKSAKYNFLVLTDADCKPISSNWLREMSSFFSATNAIVLGYSAYQKIKNSFLNKLIRFETVLTGLHYFSNALKGDPFMGVGRNLAYRKELFFSVNGFQSHMQLRSGDDDLFINQVATAQNTAVCFTKQSFTVSKPKVTLNSWIKQKRRHITTASYYKRNHQLFLSLFFESQILFWIMSLAFLLKNFHLEITLPLIAIRWLVFYLIYVKALRKLNENDLLLYLPVLEIFLILVQLVIFITNLFTKPNSWK